MRYFLVLIEDDYTTIYRNGISVIDVLDRGIFLCYHLVSEGVCWKAKEPDCILVYEEKEREKERERWGFIQGGRSALVESFRRCMEAVEESDAIISNRHYATAFSLCNSKESWQQHPG